MLTEQTLTDKIEVVTLDGYKLIQVREAKQVLKDGEVLASNYNRHVVAPTDDLTNESAEVVAIANAVFTQEMKDAYTAAQASTQPSGE
jgi:hypothetical protein